MGLDPNHQMTEREIYDYHIPEGVGVHCTDPPVRWLGRDGRDATAGILADSLRSIGLENVSDRLICLSRDSVQVSRCNGDLTKIILIQSFV